MSPLYHVLCSFLLTLTTASANEQSPQPYSPDLQSLLSFKSSAGHHATGLRTWIGPDPCSGSWAGIRCANGRVASIVLDDAALAGAIDSLLQLSELQVVSLRRNSLTGNLPALSNFTNPSLRFLLLSRNQLNGTLNISLPSLVSLRLEHNGFSGGLEGLHVPGILDFNVSNNLLVGEIPFGLSNLSNSAFGGNLALCGSPLPRCLNRSQIANTSTSPSPTPPLGAVCAGRTLTKMGAAAIVAIGVGDVVVVSFVLAALVGTYLCYTRKQRSLVSLAVAAGRRSIEVDGACPEEKKREDDIDGSLVCFEGGEDLKLECLLKASAEVLGKGTTGSTYKAVLDGGLVAVAVKRLDVARFPHGGEDFDVRMRVVGALRHAHVVSLRAYHNMPSEKLLIYDYMPNGSLQSLLHNHGGRSKGAKVISWRSRKEMLMEAAQGLNFIHTFTSRRPLVHGNVKPSNILIDGNSNACISEWGLMHLAKDVVSPSPLPCSYSSAANRQTVASSSTNIDIMMPNSCDYRAPELVKMGGKATQASDVYSFGMVLLEVVTDKEINDVEWEEEVMGMAKIGLMCTDEQPEQRPRMSQVLRMISELL